jgi:hypothetical protein
MTSKLSIKLVLIFSMIETVTFYKNSESSTIKSLGLKAAEGVTKEFI